MRYNSFMDEGLRKKEKATDMELALFLIKHINDPCEDLEGNNIRDFYIREAKKALPTIQDAEAKRLLEEIIQEYSV
ncbi:MAG: hypothetical protein UU82_C0007G0012 [Candidatus Nomurabacteria bacterium GW2011_GWC2_41_8]|uniref:Uncharacterized protein n=3 Tax=Candidatus Nomuraibacteriota TaxID=1752729 RepID=A0A1F6YA10_9BACT|nr:MAG: hypothetical protein UU58_C0003G0031 [Candidatus Nomurabacteria bacterium GW2011_GWA2_41_25]KKS24341.1 MAG: hypothetical protein UU82_C0007G0012 [Candidatus Nomurabacteria bacterium GW2011_GWC2_41_8]OGI67157.1 MAG: hypothetical protein A2823_01875 [Candidatus Nomurabacteria bacterium RIFCSPHIGHO2_01_FULL_41_91]OGI80286.1 MAG: hypothetical protein A3D43_01260 [Candidatus Nomurabacteria bacterium RIFCSPHIGHO2_02_FULL_41_52]OGI94184.1 MAG: hypothetical protein A3A07_00295 [Candidatus Nomur